MKKMPIKLFILSLVYSSSYANQCKVEEIPKHVDCIQCENHLDVPSGFFEETISSIMEFTTKDKQNKKTLNKLIATERFLSNQMNLKSCSNYSSLERDYITLFQKNLEECSEGPKLLNNNKQLCEWVFGRYGDSIEDRFYDIYARVDERGIPREVPGKKQELEKPMRAHLNWCNDIKELYENKIFISCTRTEDNIRDLDRIRKIDESMKRDLDPNKAPPKPVLTLEQQRQENLKEACKYFDENPPTLISRDFYIQCIFK